MALLDDILTWTETLPAWQQDAARRLFQKPEGLSEQDYAELYVLLKAAHGIPNPEGLLPAPLSKDHLPSVLGSGDTVSLKALRNLNHVNCIATDQVLCFSPSGLTVIYGGNGSGKSGYARVMKRACRARDQEEPIYPDANNSAERDCIPEAVLDIEVNALPTAVHWRYTDPAPDALASIAVFDCHCARMYLTNEQEVAYLPYGLDIVEALANTVLPELARRVEEELRSISTDSSQFAELSGDTDVGRLISTLNHKTAPQEVRGLAGLSDEELRKIEELHHTLLESDPSSRAEELRLSAQRLKELDSRFVSSISPIDDEALASLKRTWQESSEADRAEREAARMLHADEALLPGTGEAVWKMLFEAARKFSVEQAYPNEPFPYLYDGARCVLCQQPLRDATDRIRRFDRYLQEDVARTASSKRHCLAQARNALLKVTVVVSLEDAIGTELDQLDPAIRPMIDRFNTQNELRYQAVLAALESGTWDAIPRIAEVPRKAIRAIAARQYRRARDYERACDEKTAAVLREECKSLEARKRLSGCLPQVLALLESHKKKHVLGACTKDLNTRPISMKSRELAGQVVTIALKDALDAEFELLGIGHIHTRLKDRNVKGRILHQLLLDLPTVRKVWEILSEGEQRAIALGSFLAELRLARHLGAIVFDDPVSSLDHKRRELVAKRLAEESSRRQVIVFTHDIVFLNQLQNQCDQLGTPIAMRFLEKVGKQAGAVQDGLPWDHKSYADRITCLENSQKEFEDLPWPPEPPENLARQMIQQYSFLRATIERVVQDVVLNGTIRRFEEYVRLAKLEGVIGLEQSQVVEIQRLYKRCHSIVEAHDPASAIDKLPPTAHEFGKDIAALKSVIDAIKTQRRK